MRNIQSIKVTSKTVYVNFDNGTFGTRSFFDGKWNSWKLSDEELAKARELAQHDGKWQNYTAPSEVAIITTTGTNGAGAHDDEDDAYAVAKFDARPHVVSAEPEIFG